MIYHCAAFVIKTQCKLTLLLNYVGQLQGAGGTSYCEHFQARALSRCLRKLL